MTELHNILITDAEDSEVRIVSCSPEELKLRVKIDVLGGKLCQILCRRPLHVDLSPVFMLGSLSVGGADILPDDYLRSRNRGYDGDEDSYHVLKFTDQDENSYFVISCEQEEISEIT